MAVGPMKIMRLVVRFQNGQFVATATECLQQATGLLRLAESPRFTAVNVRRALEVAFDTALLAALFLLDLDSLFFLPVTASAAALPARRCCCA